MPKREQMRVMENYLKSKLEALKNLSGFEVCPIESNELNESRTEIKIKFPDDHCFSLFFSNNSNDKQADSDIDEDSDEVKLIAISKNSNSVFVEESILKEVINKAIELNDAQWFIFKVKTFIYREVEINDEMAFIHSNINHTLDKKKKVGVSFEKVKSKLSLMLNKKGLQGK